MINRLKCNISLTLVEVLIAMLILSASAAGVLGSFSYAFKFIQRAGKKAEAMNYGRKTQEAFRAIWLLKGNDTAEPRLNDCAWTDIKSTLPNPPNMGYLVTNPVYDGKVFYNIVTAPVGSTDLPPGTKQIGIKVEWNAP